MFIGAATVGNSMEVPQKTKNRTTIWSRVYSWIYIWEKRNTSSKWYMLLMFIAALLTIAKIWKQPKSLSTDELLAAKSLQSCLTLCDPIDGSPPGSPVPGILQSRVLEWVAISFSNAGKWKVKVKSFSRVRLLANPWTAAYQAPPSMGFSRQEYWSGVPLMNC